MASSKSAFAETKWLDYLFGGTTFTLPGTWYVALSTAAFTVSATGAAMTEVTGGSYARQSLANNTTNFPAATGSNPATKVNATAATFPTATANWGTVLSAYLVDALTSGNAWYGCDLAAGVPVNSGSGFSIPIGQLVITEL